MRFELGRPVAEVPNIHPSVSPVVEAIDPVQIGRSSGIGSVDFDVCRSALEVDGAVVGRVPDEIIEEYDVGRTDDTRSSASDDGKGLISTDTRTLLYDERRGVLVGD